MAAITAPFPMTRGRRAALVIGVPVCLFLVAATGLPPAYLPQKPHSQKPQGETS